MTEIIFGMDLLQLIQISSAIVAFIIIYINRFLIDEYTFSEDWTDMIMNVRLIIAENPEINSFEDLVGSKGDLYEEITRDFDKNPRLLRYGAPLGVRVETLILTPILAILIIPLAIKKIFNEDELFNVVCFPPSRREFAFLSFLVAALLDIVIFVLALVLISSDNLIAAVIGSILFLFAGVSFIGSITVIIAYILDQTRWKQFWKKHLFQLMVIGTVTNNLDLHTRAKFSYDRVEKVPSLFSLKEFAIIGSVIGLINLLVPFLLV